MKIDVHKLSDQYWHNGWTTLPALDRWLAIDLQRRALRLVDDYTYRRDGEASGGGHSRYEVFDGFTVKDWFPELTGLAHGLLPLIRHVTGQGALLSPYQRSGINVKVYRGPGNGQGWHFDSNPITLLLYLAEVGKPLHFEKPDGSMSHIKPGLGKMVLMRGKDCRHHVPPNPKGGGARIVSVFNLYTEKDCDRPNWLDHSIYENAPVPT